MKKNLWGLAKLEIRVRDVRLVDKDEGHSVLSKSVEDPQRAETNNIIQRKKKDQNFSQENVWEDPSTARG